MRPLSLSPQCNSLLFDVVIIGGGIAGCSTAYYLRKLSKDIKIAIMLVNNNIIVVIVIVVVVIVVILYF